MAYVPIKPEELKKLIKMSKNRPMNFAYNPGPKGADLLLLDKILPPEKLGRTAKKEGEGPKAAYGTFDLHGRKLKVTAIHALPEMARKLRKYLKTLSFSFSIEVLDDRGQSLESDLSEEDLEEAQENKSAASAQPADKPGEAEETTGESAQDHEQKSQDAAAETKNESETQEDSKNEAELAEAATRRKALTERVRALQEPVGKLGGNGAQLKKAIALAVGFLKEGALEKAEMTLGKVEESLAKAQSTAASDAKDNEAEKAPDPKALIARAGSLKKVLDQSQSPQADAIKKQMVQALALLKSRDFAGAEAGLTAAENALNSLNDKAAEKSEARAVEPSEAKTDESGVTAAEETAADETDARTDAQAEWAAIIGPLQAEVDAAMQAKRGDLDAINRAFNYAKAQADAGAHASALKAAESTRKLLQDATDATGEARVAEAEDAIPDNVVACRKSRLNWINTRNGLYADLMKLKMTIDAKAREIEGLEEIAQNTSALVDYLEDLDSTLEDKLNALVETADGAERQKLKEDSIKIIRAYRSTLDGEFFQAVDQNGFTETKIRARALDALSGVETALAA